MLNLLAMPGTSDVRRALRVSHTLDLFPPVGRPGHIPMTVDTKAQWLCWPAGELLAKYVPPIWVPPFTPRGARRNLLRWCQELSDLIYDASRGTHSLQRLVEAADAHVDAMQDWLDGQWSTRESLIELLWRLELGERTIGAALWLHRIADDGTGRSKREGN
jgi:hypothetical protein